MSDTNPPSTGQASTGQADAPQIVVALDGPASSGKSSVGAAAAARLGLRFLDTGLIYRALTALALREGVHTNDAERLVPLVDRVDLEDDGTGRLTRVMLDGIAAADDVHSPEVDAAVSAVSRLAPVRSALLARQRSLAAIGGIVVAGRDIGTVVLPDADLKLFLDASIEERASRRISERGLDPEGAAAAVVRTQLRRRDEQDRTREVAPLRAADDAVVIATDGITFDGTVDLAVEAIRATQKRMAASATKRTRRRRQAAARTGATVAAARAATSPPAPEPAPAEPPAPEPAPAEPAPVEPPAPEPAPAEPTAAEVPAGAAIGTDAAATADQPASPEPTAAIATSGNGAAPAARPDRVATTRDDAARREAGRAPSDLLERAMRLENDLPMWMRMIALLSRIGARLVADVRVEGLDRIPRRGAVILAPNHASNADPFVTGAWITAGLRHRRLHWLGKRELFAWPVFGWLAARGGVHPVDRGTADVEAYRLATRILEKGYVLLIFPEGTRSPDGALQEARDGMATLAMRTDATIVPIGVNGSDRVWPRGQKIPLPIPRRRITVRVGRPFKVRDVVPEGTDRRAAKTIATTAIMGRIAALLEPRQRGFYADVVPTEDPSEPMPPSMTTS